MSLPDAFERAGVVLGSILMGSLPASLLLQVVEGANSAWWAAAVLVLPGFVVGWLVAAGRAPFDYDAVWFVCFLGYVLTLGGVAALELQPVRENERAVFAVAATGFALAAVIEHYR